MDPQPDVIRQQIDETRSSLTEKLETLEAEVKGTVQSARETVETAKESVQETISNVKETVASAKETVKQTFDIPYQVDHHPWAMLGLSFVSGVIAGVLLGGRVSTESRIARGMSEASVEPPERGETTPAAAWSRVAHGETGRPGFMDKLGHQVGEEVEKAKDLAITTIAGVVGDVARRSIPALGQAVEEMMTRVASQVGAPPPQYGEQRRETATESGYRAPPMY
jgi:ElaB/YqjD/DUF883 family membrane-anchored ribosome-binding protein